MPAPTTIVPSFETEQAQAAPPKKTDIELQRRFEHAKLSLLVWVEQHPKSAKTWFALEQRGTLSRFEADGGKKQITLDITDRVRYGGERGLLGMAFHPTFPEAPFIYVNYTHDDKSRGLISRVSRFTTKDKGKTFDPGSEKVLLSYEQPYGNHNGGQILFGPDKMLYIGVGDGGSGGDPKKHGQNTKTLLGTILRIDVNKDPYGIPADNPFANQGGRKEIYAYGLRNPWRMSFDRKTGDLWVGDVGQNAYEEINVVQKGKNYGWRTMEGTHCFDPEEGCNKAGLAMPILDYPHSQGRSVTGGYVYRGKIKSLQGQYIYGDFVAGRVWAWNPSTKKNRELFDTEFGISTFVEDQEGELYVVDYATGAIHMIVAKGK